MTVMCYTNRRSSFAPHTLRSAGLAAVVAAATLPTAAMAQTTASYAAPTFDRWNYPFNATPGQRDVATTFSPGFVPGMFDDRDGQFLVSFATSGDFAAGLGAQNYVITSARVTASIDPRFGGTFTYDGTKDAVGTYREAFQPGFTPDTDAGRPVELFATGFNAGFNAQTWGETGPFAFGDPTLEDVRIAYAADFDENGMMRNVSNNVRDNFETNSLAVGTIAGATQGDLVEGNATYGFDVDVSDAFIQAYLAQSLDAGIVSFSISSLHLTTQGGPIEFPGFYTKETFFPDGLAPTLELTVQIVPAPATAGLIALGGIVSARRRR